MISQQLLSLIYGSIVSQVISSSQHYTQVNVRLQKIGFKIGNKLLDQYMKQYSKSPCTKINQLVQRFSYIGIKKFINPTQIKYTNLKINQNAFSFQLQIKGNPYLKNLQLSSNNQNNNLEYQSIIKGCIRGVFDVMKLKAKVTIKSEQINKNRTFYYIQAEKKNQHVQ